MLTPILLRTGVRDLLRRPLHTALMLLGVALGVAVVVAVDLASHSASRAFSWSTEAVVGRATHQVLGGPDGVPLPFYRHLRLQHLVDASAPVVEASGVARELGQQSVRLLGIDPLADGAFRDLLGDSPALNRDLNGILVRRDGCLLAAAGARRHGLSLGMPLHVAVDGRVLDLTISGLIEDPDADRADALDGLVLLDVGALQVLLGRPDRLTRIDLIATPRQAAALEQRLPPGLRLAPAGESARSAGQLAGAFQLNLRALSLLALVVGTFLVYNTVTFAVVQRRAVFGTLRTLGVTGRQIFVLVLVETAVTAGVGSLVGVGLGYALGQGVVRLVTRTINDFYFAVSVVRAPLGLATIAKGAVLGVGAALAAALLPAAEAARVEPVTALRPSTLESASRRWLPRLALLGAALTTTGAFVLASPRPPRDFDFPALFAVVLGAASTVPWLTLAAMRGAALPLGWTFGLVGALGARTVARAVSRTGVATAALMTAVAVAVGVTLMIGSFRSTVHDWLELTLLADLYVGAGGGVRSAPSLSPDLVARIARTKGVASLETDRRVRVMSSLGEIALRASDIRRRRSLSLYRFRDGAQHPWEQVEAGDVVVSEPFAHRHRLPRHGGRLEILTDRGTVGFRIAGVFYDYASEEGVVVMSRSVYDRYWSDRDVSSIAVYVEAGAKPDVVADSLRGSLAGTSLQVTPTASLKRRALQVFDRTFAVTDALRLLALIVAFIGVWSALLALQVERTRELATLSALGFTPGQLSGLCLVETGLMGLEAGLLSIPLGVALAFVLVNVVNVHSFGWTMQLSYAPGPMLEAVVASVSASLLAAVYPVIRLRRLPVAAALRME